MTEELTLQKLSHERAKQERRYKLLPVGIHIIMELLYPIRDGNIISKIKLPDDVHPIDVHYSLDRQSFLFLLESESFPHVEPGEEIPYLDGELWSVTRNQVIIEENYQTYEKTVNEYMRDIYG